MFHFRKTKLSGKKAGSHKLCLFSLPTEYTEDLLHYSQRRHWRRRGQTVKVLR